MSACGANVTWEKLPRSIQSSQYHTNKLSFSYKNMALNTIVVLSKFTSGCHVISCDWVSCFTYAAHQHGCIRAWSEHKEKHRASWWSTPHCCSRCTVCIILVKKNSTSASMAVRRYIIFKLKYYINKAHCTHIIPVLLMMFFFLFLFRNGVCDYKIASTLHL